MKISLIVPVYNEEEAIPVFYHTVRNFDKLTPYTVEILFVNDGSQDKTEDIIEKLADQDALVTAINLSRNFGKESALFAGLDFAKGDAVIPIDVDLQDPIEVIPQLIKKYQQGYDVVLAKRSDRHCDTLFKRKSAQYFYKISNLIFSPKIEENVGDFRLMDIKVVEAARRMPERNLFMKGVLSWVGFNAITINYTRTARISGKKKFNVWKLWNLALDGITSFSTFPLKLWTYIGLGISLLSFFYMGLIILKKIVFGDPVPGYPSLMAVILFLGGIQLISTGVLGEYIGRIYIETKQRPRYIIKNIKKINDKII